MLRLSVKMQRWFFLEERKKQKVRPTTTLDMTSKKTTEKPGPIKASQQWVFTVRVPNIGNREEVFITGATVELGEWDHTRMVGLEHQEGTDLWFKSIEIPNTCDVYYRYVIGTVVEQSNEIIVHLWETALEPRVIKDTMLHPTTDVFGEVNCDGHVQVSRGWLTTQSLLQFKFMNNPFNLRSRTIEKNLSIKITPVKLSFGNPENHTDESCQSIDTLDSESSTGSCVEVATLGNIAALCSLQPQEQFGREYKPNDVLLVNVTVPDMKVLAYLVDFYSYSSRAASTDPPCHIGYAYVLPNMFKPSEGTLLVPITCNVKHRPLGTVTIHYLIINPMPKNLCDLQVSFVKYWNPAWTGLEVGHRGLGASFKTKEGNSIRENTIASLKKAAASGADLLEFDVQLSKDMIPVIYHDYTVCISMKRKKELEFSEMLELPVKDLTLEHLQKLKVYHLVEGRNHELLFNDEDLEEHQPFPTLESLLYSIDKTVGFNVELKWNMELQDGSFELSNPFDMNTYVDKVLEVILLHAGDRRIVFSCFNPDICTMVRHKQNKYPTMFLTQGVTDKYPPYRDPRCLSIEAAVQNAISSDILGIAVHTEDLLRDPTQVKLATDAGLVMFCWGDDNNDKATISRLKAMGLHAVIYDKLDQFTTKNVKESIFLVEARESQRDLMKLATMEEPPSLASESRSSSTLEHAAAPAGAAFLDMGVRQRLETVSTVTSLESIACSIDFRDEFEENKSLKRNSTLISNIEKESQVKEQVNTFRGLFPSGDHKDSPKKSRSSD